MHRSQNPRAQRQILNQLESHETLVSLLDVAKGRCETTERSDDTLFMLHKNQQKWRRSTFSDITCQHFLLAREVMLGSRHQRHLERSRLSRNRQISRQVFDEWLQLRPRSSGMVTSKPSRSKLVERCLIGKAGPKRRPRLKSLTISRKPTSHFACTSPRHCARISLRV